MICDAPLQHPDALALGQWSSSSVDAPAGSARSARPRDSTERPFAPPTPPLSTHFYWLSDQALGMLTEALLQPDAVSRLLAPVYPPASGLG